MEYTEWDGKLTKITVGQAEMWTRRFGKNRALLIAVEEGLKKLLLHLHQKLPNVFELFVDDEGFLPEDMEGYFAVIVDPEVVRIGVIPGKGLLSFEVDRCGGDCDNCEYNDCNDREEETNG